MDRNIFIKSLLSLSVMNPLKSLARLSKELPTGEVRMPVLFLGHGSPMNGIEDNEFVRGFIKQGQLLPKPHAIIVVSAHWETRGTYVTAMPAPRTIHDFGGFPRALYEVQYPAPGSPELAKQITELVQPEGSVHLDDQWGLDHGSWTVVKHLFPDADVPVIQLSLDRFQKPKEHYALAQQLSSLRDKGILIIGSGNVVHNLGKVAWDKLGEPYAYDWALEASDQLRKWIMEGNHQALIDFKKQGRAFDLAIPTPEHYLPLLYSLALQSKDEEVQLFNDLPLGGSLSMMSVKIG
jgi:4,5-DOPA dioxygenase extradiol